MFYEIWLDWQALIPIVEKICHLLMAYTRVIWRVFFMATSINCAARDWKMLLFDEYSKTFQDQLKAQKVTGLVLIGMIQIVENMTVVTKETSIFLQKLKHRVLLFELQKSQQVNFYLNTQYDWYSIIFLPSKWNLTKITIFVLKMMVKSRKNIFEIPSCGKLFCNNSLFRAKTQKLVVVTKNI